LLSIVQTFLGDDRVLPGKGLKGTQQLSTLRFVRCILTLVDELKGIFPLRHVTLAIVFLPGLSLPVIEGLLTLQLTRRIGVLEVKLSLFGHKLILLVRFGWLSLVVVPWGHEMIVVRFRWLIHVDYGP
jgi:hypothetical protein